MIAILHSQLNCYSVSFLTHVFLCIVKAEKKLKQFFHFTCFSTVGVMALYCVVLAKYHNSYSLFKAHTFYGTQHYKTPIILDYLLSLNL